MQVLIIPFALGIGLAYYLYPSFAPKIFRFSYFQPFYWNFNDITAFPVLRELFRKRTSQNPRLELCP
jgi:hypothetical protein